MSTGSSAAYRPAPTIRSPIGSWASVGSGVEYGFTPNWSGKIEYNYLDFGTKSVAFADQFGNASSFDLKQTVQTVKLGVNHRYNWAAACGLPNAGRACGSGG